jgi:predicted CopG family antitoxin
MAVKTITIDIEAYDILARRKRTGQSFSQVIKEHFGSSKTGRDLAAALSRITFEDDALKAMDEQVAARAKSRARAVRL